MLLTEQRVIIRFYLDNGVSIYRTLRMRMLPSMSIKEAAKRLHISESKLRLIETGKSLIDILTLKDMDEIYACGGQLIDFHFYRIKISDVLLIKPENLH